MMQVFNVRKMESGLLQVALLHIGNIKVIMSRHVIRIEAQCNLIMLYRPVDPSIEMIGEADIILSPGLQRGFLDHILA